MTTNRIINRKRLLEGRVFDVDQYDLRESDGRIVTRQVVIHGGSVVVLPVLEGERIVMIRNHRFAVDKQLWELCAGTLEEGEDPLLCAGRELIEETGYQAARITPLGGFYACPGFSTEYLHTFLATDLTHVGQDLDETEQIEVEVLAVDRVLEMIRTGQVMDAKTIATVLYWNTFLRTVS